ncbi:hypothetical protein [Pseudomonas soli]|uniref:hypothetical protein n=1 Tax=Pseudomonas soli TaxID=1306993 RepID=UPI0028A99303|nr:hypothetical protein [Pseudomonas soli]
MLKIVPDPPLSPETAHSLEDLLIQISERLFCALSVTHQNALTQVTSTARGMSMARNRGRTRAGGTGTEQAADQALNREKTR